MVITDNKSLLPFITITRIEPDLSYIKKTEHISFPKKLWRFRRWDKQNLVCFNSELPNPALVHPKPLVRTLRPPNSCAACEAINPRGSNRWYDREFSHELHGSTNKSPWKVLHFDGMGNFNSDLFVDPGGYCGFSILRPPRCWIWTHQLSSWLIIPNAPFMIGYG